MKIKPLGERVLIRPLKVNERTDSGIFIPEEAMKEKKQAIVETLGNSKDGKPFPLKKGDKVIYSGYSSEELEIDEEKYIIIDLKDILAIMED